MVKDSPGLRGPVCEAVQEELNSMYFFFTCFGKTMRISQCILRCTKYSNMHSQNGNGANQSGLNVKLSWLNRNQNGKFDDPETGTAIDLRAFPIKYV